MGEHQRPRRFREKAYDLLSRMAQAAEASDYRSHWLPSTSVGYAPVMSAAIARDIEAAITTRRATEQAARVPVALAASAEFAEVRNNEQQLSHHEQQGEI